MLDSQSYQSFSSCVHLHQCTVEDFPLDRENQAITVGGLGHKLTIFFHDKQSALAFSAAVWALQEDEPLPKAKPTPFDDVEYAE